MFENFSGSSNTAIGFNALFEVAGDNNIGVGNDAGLISFSAAITST
jgi:hypothetical protein